MSGICPGSTLSQRVAMNGAKKATTRAMNNARAQNKHSIVRSNISSNQIHQGPAGLDSFQISVWCDRYQEFRLDQFIDFDPQGLAIHALTAFIREPPQVFPNGSLRIISLAPGPVRKQMIGKVFYKGIEHNA